MLIKDRNALNTKFLTQFANNLSAIGHDVHVVCDSYKKPGEGEVLASKVKFTNLSQKSSHSLINLYLILRKHLSIPSFRFNALIKREKPDIILCYFPVDLFNVRFLQKKSVPVILMGHNYPPKVFEKFRKKSRLRQRIYRDLIESVEVFQVLNPDFEKTVEPYYHIKRVVTIGNAVTPIAPENRANLDNPNHKIIYVGRIAKEGKRQHLLIEAFSKLAHKYPQWSVEFWGLEKHKSYKEELLQQIKNEQLENQVFLKGYTTDIESKYQDADINAFPSKYEGFGLGLADGMAMGLPSIGFDYAPSVNSLIKDGQNGFLVSNLDEFTEKLDLLMSDKPLRIKLGNQAAEDMKQFSPELIIKQWDQLIAETVSRFNSEAGS